MSFLKRISSHLFVIPEFKFQSEHSGEMDVRWEHGRLVLNSENANYSFNELHKVFQKCLDQRIMNEIPAGPVLNLGMGAGSVVSILRNERFSKRPITSIEYDARIIEVARSHFGIDRYADHKILHMDALEFLEKDSNEYALIIVDLFKDRRVDVKFLSSSFFDLMDEHLLINGRLLFNLIDTESHPIGAHIPERQQRIIKYKKNRVLVYQKTDRS